MEDKQIQTTLTEQVPEWKIKLAYFYAENKIVIKRSLVFALFFADIIIVFLFGSVLLNYQTGTIKEQNVLNKMRFNLVNTQAISKNKPKNLIIGEISAIRSSDGKYNFVVPVQNNNNQWAVTEIRYTLNTAGKYLEPRTTFILPNSKKQLMYFNADGSSNAALKILDTNWQKIKDFSLLSYKDGIKVKKSIFNPSSSGQLSGEVEIVIFNDTPYSFWEVGLPVVIYNRNSKPIGIDYVVINKLMSREERKIEIGWHEKLTDFVSRVEVHPEVNLLSKEVIMKIEAPPGSPPGLE